MNTTKFIPVIYTGEPVMIAATVIEKYSPANSLALFKAYPVENPRTPVYPPVMIQTVNNAYFTGIPKDPAADDFPYWSPGIHRALEELITLKWHELNGHYYIQYDPLCSEKPDSTDPPDPVVKTLTPEIMDLFAGQGGRRNLPYWTEDEI